MHFKVSEKPLVEDNPGISSVPAFRDVPDRILKYIFLVFDFKSPYRNIPIEVRKVAVAKAVEFKMESDGKRMDKNAREVMDGKHPQYKKALEAFMELQDDQEQMALVAQRKMIDDYNKLLMKDDKTEKEFQLSLKINEKMPEIIKNKRALEEIVESRGIVKMDGDVEEDDREISTLDEYNSEGQE